MQPRLQTMLDELLSLEQDAQESTGVVELDQTRVGRLSRMDAMQLQQMALESSRRRQQSIRQIRAALARIESGDYGDCLECGEPINPKRLEIDPATRLCIDCASLMDSQ